MYEPAAVSTFLQVADYYLVAHAHAHRLAAVMHEVVSDSKRKIKIPNACIGLGVTVMSPYEMLRPSEAVRRLGEGYDLARKLLMQVMLPRPFPPNRSLLIPLPLGIDRVSPGGLLNLDTTWELCHAMHVYLYTSIPSSSPAQRQAGHLGTWGAMRLVLVNINTNEALTQRLLSCARHVCGSGTEIIALTPRFGPESVESRYENILATVGVLDRLLCFTEPYDGVVLAGFGDNGREPLQELLDVPVVDITDAAAYLACLVAPNFSVVTTVPRAVSQITERLRQIEFAERCRSVRPTGLGVLEILQDPDAAVDHIAHQAREALERDHAEAICLGCAAMAGLAPRLADRIQVPVIDGLSAAVTLLESLFRLGLSTSKRMTYSSPADTKKIIGWPMEVTSK